MKISIITVCLNSEKTLERTIKSVIEQNYNDLEFVIIDGKSEDHTLDIIRRYEKYISYWCSEKDGGTYDAMNKGLSHATGDIVAFLNSDDWYEPGVLGYVSDYFENNKVDVLVGEIKRWSEDRKIPDIKLENDLIKLRQRMIFCHQAVFMSGRVFESIGNFDIGYKISADYDLILKAYEFGFAFGKVDRYFANYNCSGLSSIQEYLLGKEAKTIALKNAKDDVGLQNKIEKEINLIKLYNRTISNLVCRFEPSYVKDRMNIKGRDLYLWGAGGGGLQCYIFLTAAGIKVKGFIDSFKNRDELNGFEVLSPDQIPKDVFICITVINYEMFFEIKELIEKLGFSSEDYVWYEDIELELANYGKTKYDSYILK